MPGKVKVKILSGRNLPVMDRGSLTTDAFVEIKLGTTCYKTEVARKTLNPQWNSDWYRFEVDDADLQDEPLQIRIMDYDTYSANDAIGKVYISLNPLLLPHGSDPHLQKTTKGSVMSGWIPVYDTLQGIRGEVNLIVKVELFSDVNKFRESSCGVQFFYSSCVPHGFIAQTIHGFVEELVVNDDPEYQWIDKIRTPRASNEARHLAFLKLSGQVQRKIGLKAIEMGANAVLGYSQSFDLEGDIGVVARGTGTAVTLVRIQEMLSNSGFAENALLEENELLPSSPSTRPFHPRTESVSGTRPAPVIGTPGSAVINITKEAAAMSLNRRSSDSDLSITPKGNSLNSGDRFNAAAVRAPILRAPLNPENLDMLEYPFLTVSKFPAGFILHLGATVSARSVKLLERVPNPDEPESRDSWWKEIRMEIRSHAKTIGCNVVLGYSEVTTITDDVCVLSATGTAAVVNFSYVADVPTHLDTSGSSRGRELLGSSLERRDLIEDGNNGRMSRDRRDRTSESDGDTGDNDKEPNGHLVGTPPPHGIPGVGALCCICHSPFAQMAAPLKAIMSKCAICLRFKVPEVLLATVELPDEVQTTGRGCLIQAHVIRGKRDLKTEANAKEISDGLPFLEYELHRQLICKLKVKGMNAIFGLKTTLAVGERIMTLVATGTAVFVTALPSPKPPKIVAGNSWTDIEKLGELQKSVNETMERNREQYQLKSFNDNETNNHTVHSDTEGSDEDIAELDLGLGSNDATILEVDDIQDLEVIGLLSESSPPDGFHVVNIQYVPGMQDLDLIKHLQMFTQVWRAKVPPNQPNSNFSKHFQRLLQTIYFKLRTMIPCAIAGLRFLISIPEADEMQILVTGMAYGLGEQGKINKFKKRMIAHSISRDGTRRMDDDLIFNLDEDAEPESPANLLHTGSLRLRKKSPTRVKNKVWRHVPIRERYGVDITPLFSVPGGHIEKYLGNLNFFFIRESTSIREIGGISGFIHSFITELLAVVRAHVTALGGNAIVSFYMTELMMVDNPHKNQGQCLINVGGDVVFVSDIIDD